MGHVFQILQRALQVAVPLGQARRQIAPPRARHGASGLPVQRAAPATSPAKRAPSRVRPANTGVQTVRPANRTATRIVLPEVAHRPARPASVGAGLLRAAWQQLHPAQTAPFVRPINSGAVLPSGACRTTSLVTPVARAVPATLGATADAFPAAQLAALLAARLQEGHAQADNISAITTVLPMAVHAMVIHTILQELPLDSQLLTSNLRKIADSAKNTMG